MKPYFFLVYILTNMTLCGIIKEMHDEKVAQILMPRLSIHYQWLESPGHRANILNPKYTDIGVGFTCGGAFWAQMFIGQ